MTCVACDASGSPVSLRKHGRVRYPAITLCERHLTDALMLGYERG